MSTQVIFFPPRETVHDSFPSHGLSISKKPPIPAIPDSKDTNIIETFAYSSDRYPGFSTCKCPLCQAASSIAFLHYDKYALVSAMKHLHRTSACFRSRANFEPLSTPLQYGIRFFQHPKPAHMRTPCGYPELLYALL